MKEITWRNEEESRKAMLLRRVKARTLRMQKKIEAEWNDLEEDNEEVEEVDLTEDDEKEEKKDKNSGKKQNQEESKHRNEENEPGNRNCDWDRRLRREL